MTLPINFKKNMFTWFSHLNMILSQQQNARKRFFSHQFIGFFFILTRAMEYCQFWTLKHCECFHFTKFLKTHLAVSVAWIYDSCRKITIDSFAGFFSVFFGTVVLIYIVPIFLELFCFNEDTVTLQFPLIKNVMEWRQ